MTADSVDEVRLTVADAMVVTAESVNSHDTVATATKKLTRHHLTALPVVEDGRVAGLVTPQQLLAAAPYRLVVDVMTPGITPVPADLPLVQAYAAMTRQRLDVLPVIEDNELVGQISAANILRKQGQQSDPLTGLPSAAALRAWASAALAHGHEVSVLFIDLDNFGIVNKTLGHVAGDDMLVAVAELLGGLVRDRTDMLCRYGGDEFAIATTRREPEARELAERIQAAVVLPTDLTSGLNRVTASIGLSGGRRTEGRTRAHLGATIDDLLTLASRASTAAKDAKHTAESTARLSTANGETRWTAVPPADTVQQARLRLVDVTIRSDEAGSEVAVVLRLGARESTGRAAGRVHGQGIFFLAAEATLDALRLTAGEEHVYTLEEFTEVPTAVDKLAVVVLANRSNGATSFIGSARAPDLTHAVVKAVLDALNRPLSRTLAQRLAGQTA
ncbi:MAG TPA: GGDEF domain-containing protein [bacterium]|nr:GGDEF domain-containing protein [bacterium]